MQSFENATPLMQQYGEIRSEYPDAVLLFQVGDFYELFFDDAKKVAAFLGIALTTRGKYNGEPIPLCGVPVHTLDHYLTKLVKGGFKVALCDQLEMAQPGKMVRRGVTRVLTPGTLSDTVLLEEKSASYLCSFVALEQSWALVFGELLTAQLFGTVLPVLSHRSIESELIRFLPDEILLPATTQGKQFQAYFKQLGYSTSLSIFDESDLAQAQTCANWISQFKQDTQSYLAQEEALRLAAYHFYSYVRMTQQSSAHMFSSLSIYRPDDYLILDTATQHNLELVHNNQDRTSKRTLLSVIDGATTPMGSRMLKKWLLRPLVKKESIEQRLDVVQAYVDDFLTRTSIEQVLSHFGDFERIVGRIALSRAHVHDYTHLARIVQYMPELKALLYRHAHLPLISHIASYCTTFTTLSQLLARALNIDTSKDWIISSGFHQELDLVRDTIMHASRKIIELEQHEQQTTGINSLKIRSTDAHGYYIEVTSSHMASVPAHYIRRQTLVGRERYTMQALRDIEQEIMTARMRIDQLEREVFDQVKQAVFSCVYELRRSAHAVAHLDALLGLARIAYAYNYVRPAIVTNKQTSIEAGRHPVVEQVVQGTFIANTTDLTDQQPFWIITGPNMAGKSTYLRQVALITILGQIGSFVPAKSATLSIADRIFTRIGAGDNLSEGKSTFLVEMEETATICKQATEKSLIILDEVGRGTSTFDGLAIAQAVVEYLYTHVKARCIFATHYHELTHLTKVYPGIMNYHAACMKSSSGILFLYTIAPGVAQGSFGIEVAKLANLPDSIIERAQAVLSDLEKSL